MSSTEAIVSNPTSAARAPRRGRDGSTAQIEAAPAETGLRSSGEAYLELTRLIERLHRRFLDVLRDQLHRMGVKDINAVQALLLCNIADAEISARHLMERGYYLGSNASYNIKRLVESGYLQQRPAEHDRRSTLLKVAPKGRELCARIADADAQLSGQLPLAALESANQTLRQLERVWDDFVSDRL